MILELLGADFSKKNIGKIEIPTTAITGVSIEGSSSVVGQTANYSCKATYDDGTTRDVTASANWSVNNSYATISKGLLTIAESATTPQNVIISVSFSGKSNTKNVTVKYQDVSDKTESVLNAYGNKALTKTQRKAVDTLITSIDNASYKSKIKQLFIPILASDLGKAMVDVMAEDYAVWKTLAEDNFVVGNNGLKNIKTDGSGAYLTLDSASLSASNFHVITMTKYSDINMSGAEYKLARPINYASTIQLYAAYNANMGTLAYDANSKIAGTNIKTLTGDSSFIVPIEDCTQTYGVCGGKIRLGKTEKNIIESYMESIESLSLSSFFITGYQNKAMQNEQALISVGQGLTDAEYESYHSLLHAFGEAFGLND